MTLPANKHPNALKLDASCVPPWTHKLTLAMEGFEALQESISAKEYATDGILKNYYMQAEDTRVGTALRTSRVVSLMAKHLRLAGNPLIWATLPTLLSEQRIAQMEREVESRNPVLKARGKGYIAIPDFFLLEEPTSAWSLASLMDAGDFLASHVHYGGGLILGGYTPLAESIRCFGPELGSLILSRSEQHLVKGKV